MKTTTNVNICGNDRVATGATSSSLEEGFDLQQSEDPFSGECQQELVVSNSTSSSDEGRNVKQSLPRNCRREDAQTVNQRRQVTPLYEKKRMESSDLEEARIPEIQEERRDTSSSQELSLRYTSDHPEDEKGVGTMNRFFGQDSFVQDIPPLPEASTQQRPKSLPGAFAVAGISGNTRDLPATNETNVPSIEEEQEQPVIGGAEIVEESAEAMEQGETLHQTSMHSCSEVFDGTILAEHATNGPNPTRTRQTKQRCLVLLLVLSIAMGGLVILLVFLLYPGHLTSARPEENATTQVPQVIYGPFSSDLPPPILQGIQQVGSIYYKANAWMQEDPYLETYSYGRQIQRFGLVIFYFSFAGEHWFRNDDWLSYTVSECQWFTQHPEPICDEDQQLVNFNLTHNNLTGQFLQATNIDWPQRIVRIFDIGYNHIFGPPPAFLMGIDQLEALVVSHNNLHGQFEAEGGFTAFNLRIVKLDSNRLFGYQPLVYLVLPKLEVLNITSNLYDRDITHHLQNCKNLTYLASANNLLTGPLPSELGLLTHLEEINVSGNRKIDGVIPTEFGLLSKLRRLNIDGTQMSGAIPEALCAMSSGLREESVPPLQIIANCSNIQCCPLGT